MIVISLDDEDKIRLVRIMVLSGLTIGLLAIYQYFFGFQHVLTYIKKEGIAKFNEFTLSYLSRRRAFLPFVTPNTLGGFLAMIVPLTFSFKHKNWLILLLSFALFLTKSLGAFLSFFCGLIIYFILKGRLEKKRIILLITLLVIFGLLLILRTSQQKYHLQPIFSTLMRLSYWQGALKIIQAHFLTGVGLGNFNLMQTRYAHNSYLQIWVEVGIIGLITFFWLIGIIFKTALQNIRNSPDKIGLAGLIAASFVFLLHNLIDFTFFLPEVSFYWWIILGLILKSLPNHFR
jgi:putative inorganic carbon (HCO3(-)) transporter